MLNVNEKQIKAQLSHMSKQDILKMAKKSNHDTQKMWDMLADSLK